MNIEWIHSPLNGLFLANLFEKLILNLVESNINKLINYKLLCFIFLIELVLTEFLLEIIVRIIILVFL
jgi:hypothetical protein